MLTMELPWVLEIPSPLSSWLEHFEIFKNGCTTCGSRNITFISSSLGRILNISNSPSPIIKAESEKLVYKCNYCENPFTFLFLSPSSPPISEQVVRNVVRDLFFYFSEDLLDDTTPNYTDFYEWALSMVKKARLEQSLKNKPIYKWVIGSVKDLSEEVGNVLERKSQTREGDFQKEAYILAKLLIFFHEGISSIFENKVVGDESEIWSEIVQEPIEYLTLLNL